MSRRTWLVAALVLVLVAGAGLWAAQRFGLLFTHPTVADAPRVDLPAGAVSVVASHVDTPWGIAFQADGTALVTERGTADILSITPQGTVHTVQTVPGVVAGGEAGLLGIAIGADDWVYVYYSTATDNRIARLHLGQTPEVIFTGIPRAGNHDGGRIAFGPDGLLYVGTGDATARDRAQDRDYLGGKILRLTPDGTPAPGNPFPGSPVYSYGHRNVQGLAWDTIGQLYASEFGQDHYDELNRIAAGADYGWPTVEGVGDHPGYVNPVATWATSDASPSGLAIVGDHAYLACLRGTKLYRIGLAGHDPAVLLDGAYGRLRAVAAAPDGALWVLTSNRDGRGSPTADDDRVLRIDPSALRVS